MSASSARVIDLSRRDDLRWLAQLLAEISEAAPSVEPLLVGALARDLLLHYGYGIRITRATEDIDLAIVVSDWQEFEAVRNALLAGGCFVPHKGAMHKLRHRRHGWVDLVPFGAVERLDGTIAWPPGGEEIMAVFGYQEASVTAAHALLPQGQVVRVVSLPMLAALKLLAWKDRHKFAPGKDAIDLMLILHSYLEAGNTERLYGDMAYLLTDDFDFEPTGAWLAGRDIHTLLQQHSSRADTMIKRAAEILLPELDLDGSLTLVMQMSAAEPERAHQLLAAFYRGLTGANKP
ncbi:MAG: nucleotidyl transferase AbiEii/AbiGii toxin family protein [Candidatus Competibacteraceae bacterium]|jgi:predicted nucleotidyltransferase|nr:nucleotidyl transferase AbiEii/AbiGii toxin family protein [Candidatus Competibacteraceae bacterium]